LPGGKTDEAGQPSNNVVLFQKMWSIMDEMCIHCFYRGLCIS
jgi:hypothetical protein